MNSEHDKNHLIPNPVVSTQLSVLACDGRLRLYSPTLQGGGFYGRVNRKCRGDSRITPTFRAVIEKSCLLSLLLLGLTPLWARVGLTQPRPPALEAVEDSVPPGDRERPILELQQMPPEKPPSQFLTIPPEIDPGEFNITTANTISATGVTVPSLWWVNEQFGYRLVENWLAYPRNGEDTGTVDLIVNRQTWSLLDYLQRYELLNHFGQVARYYGYNIRVFTRQQRLLGTYTCTSEPIACNLWLDSQGLDSQAQ